MGDFLKLALTYYTDRQNENYFTMLLPCLADNSHQYAIVVPKVLDNNGLNTIKGKYNAMYSMYIQDKATIEQAKKQIAFALKNNATDKLLVNYHYTEKKDKDGNIVKVYNGNALHYQQLPFLNDMLFDTVALDITTNDADVFMNMFDNNHLVSDNAMNTLQLTSDNVGSARATYEAIIEQTIRMSLVNAVEGANVATSRNIDLITTLIDKLGKDVVVDDKLMQRIRKFMNTGANRRAKHLQITAL
jgi:hypothetical protein